MRAAEGSWRREQAERALAREDAALETMSLNLLDLSQDPTCRLLEGAALSGATRGAWSKAEAALRSAWVHLDAYRQVVQSADAIRDSHPRLGPDDIRQIQELLSGASAQLAVTEIPPALRAAAGPATNTERASLEQLRGIVDSEYRQAAAVVAAVAEVWQAVDSHADRLAADLREVDEALGTEPVGEQNEAHEQSAAAAALRKELTRLCSAARGDPLALSPQSADPGCADPDSADPNSAGSGSVDTSAFERLRRDLDRLRSQVEQVRQLRGQSALRLNRLRVDVERAAAVAADAAARRKHALSRVVAHEFPAPDTARLREQLARAEDLHRLRRWLALDAALGELEQQVADVTAHAREAADRAAGLLAERQRLRHRLDGYQARAQRLGCVEDPGVDELYREAHKLLWTAPCDLQSADEALARYRRRIQEHRDGTGGSP